MMVSSRRPNLILCRLTYCLQGGNGVVRDVEFTEPIQCSILSERRVYRPFGLDGGGDAQCGLNLWMKRPREEDGDLIEGRDPEAYRTINLGGKMSVCDAADFGIVMPSEEVSIDRSRWAKATVSSSARQEGERGAKQATRQRAHSR